MQPREDAPAVAAPSPPRARTGITAAEAVLGRRLPRFADTVRY